MSMKSLSQEISLHVSNICSEKGRVGLMMIFVKVNFTMTTWM